MPFLLPAAATAMAAAAPAAAASTAAATAGATLTSIATNIAMNVAISAVMSALQPQVGAAGRTSEWTLSPDGPIPFAAGRIGVAGAVAHKATFGPDLMYLGIPAVLSGAGPIDGYETFKADEEFVAFDGNGKAVTSQYANELWYRKTLGNQPDVAVTSPPGLKNNVTLPGWGAQHKLSGKAAYMLVMGENSKGTAFPTGEIKPLITLRGLKGWDPRLDSTWPGGEGPCRLDNPATWVYLRRPGLWGLKWSLGLWEGPTLKGAPAHGSATDYQVGGIGAKLSGIDVSAFVNLENICDANDWTVSGYPTTDDDKFAVLESFLQAAGATFAMRAGKISCIQRAAPRTSIVTIGAGDTAGPLEIDTAASRIDRINTIRPRILSEAHRWQMTAIAEVSAEAYREQDGAVRPRGIDYTYVSDATQGAQLAALQIANTREGIAGVVPLKPHLQKIKPGDAFTITEPGFVLNGLKCLCLSTDFDPTTKIVAVSFVSETDAKYPFALGQSQEPPEPAVLEPVDPRYVSPPGAGEWDIVVRPPSTGGGQVPGFDLTGGVDNATATGVLVEWGPTDEGPWTQAYLGPPTVEQIPITGVQPGEVYYIAVQNIRGQNYSARQVYGPYTAPDLVSDDTAHVGGVATSLFVTRVIDVESLAAATATSVADLEDIYGDTASAAASAAAAALSEAEAAVLAGAAAGSAGAAATSAAGAVASESAAGTYAAAANTSATNAATSAGAASTSATNAASSATTASGHAATAGTAATNAATSAGLAGGSATAASGSASSAATSATNAGNSATAAAASQVAASSSYDASRAAASAAFPRDFSQDGRFWTSYLDGSAETAGIAEGTFVTVSGVGRVWQGVVGYNAGVILPRQPIAMVPGQKWRCRAKVRYVVLPGGGESIFINHREMTSGFVYNAASTVVQSGNTTHATTAWAEIETTFTVPPTWATTTAYWRPEVRGGNTGVGQIQVAWFEIEEITSLAGAANQASAAATSASNAATSATAAGTSATAASGSATTASTQAGLALTYAGQSSTSAGNSAASAVTAGTAATTATSAAATATTQASNASASAASASSSAVLAAQVGGGATNSNSHFTDWPGAYPVEWSITTLGNASKVAGKNRLPNALRIASPGVGAQDFIYASSFYTGGPGYYVMRTMVTLNSGSLFGMAMQLRGYDASYTLLDAPDVGRLWEIEDSSGAAPGYGAAGRTYEFSKLVHLPNAATKWLYFYLFVDGYYNTVAKNVDIQHLGFRPATAEEIAAGVALPALAASVSATQDVVADLEDNYALARYTLSATTPGGAAVLALESDTYGTVAGLSADKIYFGENTFFDDATDTLRTITGTNARVLALGASFGTDGQLTEWEGPAATSFAAMSRANAYFYRANVAPYVGGGAINTGTGFSASLSFVARTGSRVGAGTATTGVTTVTTVNAAGTVTYAWTRISGDAGITATAPAGAATAFSAVLAVGETKIATFQCAVSDGVTTKYVTCNAILTENT